MAKCPNCGSQVGEGAVFCDQCGAQLPTPEAAAPPAPAPAGGSVICPACGAGNVPGEAFCDFCGSPLEPPVPAVEAAPEVVPVSTEGEPEAAPVPAAAPSEAEAAPVPPPAPEKPVCPACGAEVLPGEAFCANCGASLAEPPIPPEPVPAVEEAEAVAEELAPMEAAEAAAEAVAPAEPKAEGVPQVAEAEPAVPPPTVEAAPAPPPPIPAPPTALTCAACGARLEPGDKFCSNCGAVQQPIPGVPPAEEVSAPPPPPAVLGPRLEVVASGAVIPLPPKDEILIGREDPISGIYPDVDLTPHGGEEGGVSRRHARLIFEGGRYFVEDLDSTNYTFVNQQKVAASVRQPLGDGDEIRCGRVALLLKTG